MSREWVCVLDYSIIKFIIESRIINAHDFNLSFD